MTQTIVWLNEMANRTARVVLAPIAWVPGWLSATVIALVTGVLMLLAFKYTSRQYAIKRTRDQIKANLLALSLFKDQISVCLRAQGHILTLAGRLMLLSLIPMLVMTVPMVLLLGQMALWYQARPLRVGEAAVVTVHFDSAATGAMEKAELKSTPGIESTVGPVRVATKDMVCWNIQAHEAGLHELSVHIDEQSFSKELAVGNGLMPTSLRRPASRWSDMLLHPREKPFAADSLVQSIEVAFPERKSWTSGSNWWLWYWFGVSMIAAFVARPWLKVNI